jgi:hypothetical protein
VWAGIGVGPNPGLSFCTGARLPVVLVNMPKTKISVPPSFQSQFTAINDRLDRQETAMDILALGIDELRTQGRLISALAELAEEKPKKAKPVSKNGSTPQIVGTATLHSHRASAKSYIFELTINLLIIEFQCNRLTLASLFAGLKLLN